ncbi:Uncharacterised protein [Legionella steigerwaltii]|uniref:Uncharacterized protein n=1 Tax=Legionella steigerwaltii TaxID=460 RepID=A0A378L7U1_9GAMM|nr:hypothetical protein [Legionella steigerwaltii]KTD69938.1 hypothetical protein Lstg_3379 [Legionella steigerwaltii]STY21749.1 Uncharacterised protein [Legionella steigerwaltii]
MLYYYVDIQNKNYYKWGTNEKGDPEFYYLYNSKWTEIPIKAKKKTKLGWEYDLGQINTTKLTLTTFNDFNSISLSFFSPSPSNLFGTTQTNQLHLINKNLVPFQDETAKSHKPTPSTQPKIRLKIYNLNDLTSNQIERLKEHKKMLEGRWFERRIHDYLFFCQGRTKTEKITEITKLLRGEACDPNVVEQGRTGKILNR